jgi:hypothetical protein
MKVVLVSKDLMFISRVKEVAAAHGSEVTIAKSEERLRQALSDSHPESGGVLLIDLEKAPFEIAVVEGVFSSSSLTGWRSLAFYSHVHLDVAEKARGMGFHEVMPRSKFVQVLPTLLSYKSS